MKRRSLKLAARTLTAICTLFYSCSEPSMIYIDIKDQAIHTCDGEGLKRITIENDSTEVTLEATESIIYFNKRNDAIITIHDHNVFDYVLKLKPNSNYTVTKDNGYDRGPIHITFKTNNAGKVITASDVNCN
jgi:hypothetical protein